MNIPACPPTAALVILICLAPACADDSTEGDPSELDGASGDGDADTADMQHEGGDGDSAAPSGSDDADGDGVENGPGAHDEDGDAGTEDGSRDGQRCVRTDACADDLFCIDRQCRPCPCPEGQICGHTDRDGQCYDAEPTGPAYASCQSSADCGAPLEYCLVERGICMAQCRTTADCPAREDGDAPPLCANYDGLTDDSSCVLDCREGQPCPEGMRCSGNLFCAPRGPTGEDTGPASCSREQGNTRTECDRIQSGFYECTCRSSSDTGDSASGGSVIADSCEAALDAAGCG